MIAIGEFLVMVVPVLIAVAMLTLVERKVMGSMQRRLGPNTSGPFGLGQPIADGLKLFIKQFVIPLESYPFVFVLSPVISLALSLFVWVFIPIIPGYAIYELDHSILITIALSSLAVYSILLSGWSGNSKYSVLGSIRSSAQMISYELSLTLIVITIVLGDSYSFSEVLESQTYSYNIVIYWPLAMLYGISILAETNRAPFDLNEAESELVSGFNTEHSSLPFAFFFLGEYGNMISQSLIICTLLIGGPYIPYLNLPDIIYPLVSIFKVVLLLFVFVWVRATLPRFRYDLLQDLAWNVILPICLSYLFLEVVFLSI